MYADREETQANRSIMDRLNRNSPADSTRRRPISGKRQREDGDKWEHDLFEDNRPKVSNRRVGVKDLRLKLQRKSMEQSVSGGARDLREKLSGTLNFGTIESKLLLPLRPKPAAEARKPPTNDIVAEGNKGTKKTHSHAPKRKTQQNVETVESFLHSLGLEKYSITFQAEEVDMTALIHMGDEDLKALGIPMGPRKKILLALESKD